MNKQNVSSNWTNFLEVRAYGLMRSGNHAIIEWAQSQFAGEITCFLNNLGMGYQFAAAGAVLYRKARAEGRGHELPTDWFTQDVHP